MSTISFVDRAITCVDCGEVFLFTAGEQQYYQDKGFTNEPKRCKPCRASRKERLNQEASPVTQSYPVTCAQCGTETTVPFEPRQDRPVYCRDCFKPRKRS